MPNIIHDQEYVALTDGLTRLTGLDYEGLALIVAHLKIRLSKGTPTGANGWMSVGMADYSGTGCDWSTLAPPCSRSWPRV